MDGPPRATVVVGTAGHIDHGKTALLRALTGIDADRLPEEQRRGMTIDVGFAHLALDDGTAIDFVDVPGHDRLVGNMLVGAGEIDAVLLVVAADDGPRAQTLEHLELLDGLGFRHAIVAITKVDVAGSERVAEVARLTRALVDRTTMAGAPLVAVSAIAGDGLADLRRRLVELRDALRRDRVVLAAGPLRLPIDRAFSVRGRGVVVTGTLRGGPLEAGAELRLEPSERSGEGPRRPTGGRTRRRRIDGRRTVRVREVQVHHGPVDRGAGGRTALNLSGVEPADLRRGQVLTAGDGVVSTDRLLVALRRPVALRGDARPLRAGGSVRLHLWTDSVDATIAPLSGRWPAVDVEGREPVAALLRLGRPIAALVGEAAVLRDPGSGRVVAGAAVLDARPPRGVSRRRATRDRLAALASAVGAATGGTAASGTAASATVESALLDLHGFRDGRLATDVEPVIERTALDLAAEGIAIADLRDRLGHELRHLATVDRAAAPAAAAAIDDVIERLVTGGRLARDRDRVVDASRRPAIADELSGSMARLESFLDGNVPPSLAAAAREAGCPPDGLRRLEEAGRIVRVEDDLAWSATRYAALRDLAVAMARRGPLTPAAFRDEIGGNRRVALALLEDLGRRGILSRTDAGHVPGPRA